MPQAHIGGPDSTGPGSSESDCVSAIDFLEHCAHGKNFATGKYRHATRLRELHPKGSPKWLGDHVQMGIRANSPRSIKDFGSCSRFRSGKDADYSGRIRSGRAAQHVQRKIIRRIDIAMARSMLCIPLKFWTGFMLWPQSGMYIFCEQ